MVGALINNAVRYGKHKVPRFIYHMTNKKNYEKILQSGELKTAQDALFGDGVFTTDLNNFFKHWRNDKAWDMSSLQNDLINHVRKNSADLVILRIPTKNLDHNKLFVRSQNSYFSWGNRCGNTVMDVMEEFVTQHKDEIKEETLIKKLLDELKEKIIIATSGQSRKGEAKHVMYGTPARLGKLYDQRREALEYIYTDPISTTNLEKIGEVNLDELRKSSEFDITRPMRSIFTKLLKGTPEVKGAELLNC